MPGIDLDTLKRALGAARSLGMTTIELEEDGEKFSARLSSSHADLEEEDGWSLSSDPLTLSASAPGPQRKSLSASVVGYFHPLGPWHEGLRVEGGRPVAEIQALGLANDVTPPFSGRLVELAVAEGEAVEFGQTLAYVEEEK